MDDEPDGWFGQGQWTRLFDELPPDVKRRR
jgi:hypothetical protein